MPSNNTTKVDTFSCSHPSVEGYRYFGVLWGSVVATVGTVGNMMTLLAFLRDRRLRTPFNALIFNLAVADLLYCAALQPTSVDTYLHLRWRGGEIWCRAFGLLLFLSNSVSILTLCLIAAGRYLLVTRPATSQRLLSRRGLALLLPATWALALASFGPLWPIYVFTPQVCTCSFHRTRGRPYTTLLLLFYFVFSLGCVGLFYFLLHRRVREASRALHRYRLSRRSQAKPPGAKGGSGAEDSGQPTHSVEISSSENNSVVEKSERTLQPDCQEIQSTQYAPAPAPAPSIATAPTPAPAPAPVHSLATVTPPAPVPSPAPALPPATSSPEQDAEVGRVTRMCFAVFLCFVLAFAPFLLLNMVDSKGHAPQPLHMFCANLTWLNSCINPVLYAALNRHFRQAYCALLSPLTRCCRRGRN
ncbi:G-protein coupled receptor 84 [Amia ocellicauda]|uniref:G-protein coupled receptor 84 n=1 Tax=Amia ocellicauda TaxID=2972642 RepID=UPI0034647964